MTLRTSFATTGSASRLALDNSTNANLAILEGGTENGSTSGYLAIRTRSGGSTNEVLRATSAQNVLIGTPTDMSGSAGLKVAGTTASTSTTTGSLINAGGFGNAGALFTGGAVTVGTYLDLAGDSAGSVTGYGIYRNTASNVGLGLTSGFALRAYHNTSTGRWIFQSGTPVTVSDTTASTSTTTGSLINAGGFGNAGAAYFGGNLSVAGSTITLSGSTPVIDMGAKASANNPIIDFNSSGNSNDFDVRLAAKGGTSPAGTGSLTLHGTLAATASNVGAFIVGDSGTGTATAATAVAIGGGNINAGGTGTFGGAVTATSASAHTFGTTNTVSMAAGSLTATGSLWGRSGQNLFGTDGSAQGYMRLYSGTNAGRHSNIYTVAAGGLTLETAGNAYPISIEGSGLSVMGAATFAGAVTTSSATLSGAGAIPITTSLVKFTSTAAANALTLANGVDGQRLTIVHDVKGTLGTGVLTPTTKTGFSTVTFTNAGDTVSLVYVTTRGWMVTGSYLATIAP
jgi:hypothetical protein